jgi:molybdenum cofactor cytidylyltransferase
MTGDKNFAFGIAILGAGRSRRMGTPKLLLPWRGTSIIGHLLEVWRRLGASTIAVVCAADDKLMKKELERLGFPLGQTLQNPNPDTGMFDSIKLAANWPDWNQTLTHVVFALGDQPQISHSTLQELLACSLKSPNCICQPCYGGHPRHPVSFPRAFLRDLGLSSAPDLKAFLSSTAINRVFCESIDPALDWDIDTPDDYKRAIEQPG